MEFLGNEYFGSARDNLIKNQLIPVGVKNPDLLEAFANVSRETFLAEHHQHMAYADASLVAEDQGILLPPHFLARLLQAVPLDMQGKALVIGEGAAYTAAILGELMSHVILLEEHTHLAAKQREILAMHPNVFLVEGPLVKGVASKGPYDVIVIEGAVERLPSKLFDQLSPRGSLLTFVTRDPQLKEAICFRKEKNKWVEEVLFESNVPALRAFCRDSTFDF